jgi:hypothetical protein
MKLDDKVRRKLKIEYMNRCFNCERFVNCIFGIKEDIVDCELFVEVPDSLQVIVVSFSAV